MRAMGQLLLVNPFLWLLAAVQLVFLFGVAAGWATFGRPTSRHTKTFVKRRRRREVKSSSIVNLTLAYLGGDTQGTVVWEENLAICENRDMSRTDQTRNQSEESDWNV